MLVLRSLGEVESLTFATKTRRYEITRSGVEGFDQKNAPKFIKVTFTILRGFVASMIALINTPLPHFLGGTFVTNFTTKTQFCN